MKRRFWPKGVDVQSHCLPRGNHMSMIRKLLLLTALVVLVSAPVSADSAGQAGAFLKMGVGARALGMGSAFTAIADDSTAAFWNPAGLALLEKSEASFMHANLSLDRKYNFLNYAHVVKDKDGKKKYAVALSHIRFGIDGIPETKLALDGVNPATDRNRGYTAGQPVYIFGYFDDTESATFGTYARKLSEKLYGGVNLKRLNQDLYTNSADSWGLDLGFLYQASERGTVGLSIRDIGESLKWDTDSGHSDDVPVTTTVGAAYKTSDRMTVAVDINKVEDLDAKFRAGTEYWLNKNAAVRMGTQAGDLTLGASFKLDTWRFDYSYVDETLGDAHRMSASKQF